MSVEYGLKITDSDGDVSYVVLGSRADAEETAAVYPAIRRHLIAEVAVRVVLPWRLVTAAEAVPDDPECP